MTNANEQTLVTKELLRETSKLKNSIKESMTVGERDIIKGILFFEEIIKELNPEAFNEVTISRLKSYTLLVLQKKEEDMQRVNSHMHYGIDRCLLLIDGYGRSRVKKAR